MNFIKFRFFLIICFSVIYNSFGQVELYPAHFGQVSTVRNLFNPAMQNMESPNSFIFCNQFFTGAFSKLDNLFFLGSVSLNKIDSATSKHFLGAKFVNEIEGEYINKPKYYLSYSWHTQLSDNYSIGAGLNIGRAAYIYKGTDVSSLGSDSNWDGDFGLVLYSDRLVLGLSCNQLFDSKIIPKELYFRWNRFYTAYLQKTFQLSESSIFSAYIQNQFLPNRKDVTDIGFQFTTNELLFVGSNFYVGYNFTFLAGLKNIHLNNHHFSFVASYSVPTSKNANANVQSYEMTVQYFIK